MFPPTCMSLILKRSSVICACIRQITSWLMCVVQEEAGFTCMSRVSWLLICPTLPSTIFLSCNCSVQRMYGCSINTLPFCVWLRGEGLLKTTLDLFHQAEAGHQTQLSGSFSFSAPKLRSLRQMKSLVKTDRYVIKSSSRCLSVRCSISPFSPWGFHRELVGKLLSLVMWATGL